MMLFWCKGAGIRFETNKGRIERNIPDCWCREPFQETCKWNKIIMAICMSEGDQKNFFTVISICCNDETKSFIFVRSICQTLQSVFHKEYDKDSPDWQPA